MEQENNNQENLDLSVIFNTVNKYYHETTITLVNGNCPYGHKEGEKFKVTSMNHDCMCGSLYQTIQPHIQTLMYGGGLPWEKSSDAFTASCPEMGKVQVGVKRFEQDKPVFVKTRTDIQDMTGKGFPSLDKYKVFLEVISIENICMWGHKPGERFEVDPFNPGRTCGALYRVVYPLLNLLFSGGSLPWEVETNEAHGACPDPYDLLTYRLVREER